MLCGRVIFLIYKLVVYRYSGEFSLMLEIETNVQT